MSLQEGLVGHWTMDDSDTSGGTLYDRSGSDNHGELIGSITTGVDSTIGETYSYDGTNGKIAVPYSDEMVLSKSDEVTISSWVKIDRPESSGKTWQPIIGHGNHGGGVSPSYGLHIINDDEIAFSIQNGDSVYRADWNSFEGYFTDSSFHHVAGVAKSDGTHYIYVDGIERGSGTWIGNPSNSLNFEIGSNNDGDYLSGDIGDSRLYNRALSPDEINSLYQMRSPRTQTDDLSKGLVGHWTMDDADTSGGTLYDSSAYGYNGSLENNPSTGNSSPVGEAYSFDNTNSENVDCGYNSKIMKEQTTLTLAAWVKPAQQTQAYQHIFSRGDDWTDGNAFLSIDSGQYRVYHHSYNTKCEGGTVDNEWIHMVGTFDFSRPSGEEVKLYLDGEHVGDGDSDATSLSAMSSSHHMNIAQRGGGAEFDGLVSDAHVFTRSLSADEIRRLYNKRQ